MKTNVLLADKRNFLNWYIKNHHIKECWEINRILQCLLEDETLLNNTRFVRTVFACPKKMYIRTNEFNDFTFQYQTKDGMSLDEERAFHHIRLNKNETLYVQLDYLNIRQCPYYALVMDRNPYNRFAQSTLIQKDSEIESVFKRAHLKYEEQFIREALDEALDEKDEELFIQLTNRLKLM